MKNQIKLSKNIFRLLKVNEIIYPIGRTNKGNLGIKFNESSDDFEIFLDAVPLSIKDWDKDENNIELKKLIEKYWFSAQPITMTTTTKFSLPKVARDLGDEAIEKLFSEPKKSRGRPKGTKNKVG